MDRILTLGFCDIRGDYDTPLTIQDPTTSWDKEGCVQFLQKDKQVIDNTMAPACLKVCGNCKYFTVARVIVLGGKNGNSNAPVG